MSDVVDQVVKRSSKFCSSVAADVWHSQKGEKSYEWWYFDALSDDGREALVISFSDNYVFSPRYARSGLQPEQASRRFPAISFLYSVDGKAVFRTINEYPERQFDSDTSVVRCSIGDNSFRVDSASYGSGYLVNIDIQLSPVRRLAGTFEWLMIEGDLLPGTAGAQTPDPWNIVAPRSDVTGRIELKGRTGRTKKTFHFRGTGYHDHLAGRDAIYDSIICRQWGRAHFTDATAVYCIEHGADKEKPSGRLFLVRDGHLSEAATDFDARRFRREKFGVKYPRRLNLTAENGVRMRIKPFRVLESSFYNVRFLSEMTLMMRDGKPRKAIGLTEHLAPRNVRYRLFRWFTDLTIRKNGRGPVV